MATQSNLKVTVVVVPRESFNMFPEVIEGVYQKTPPIFKMIVMEGNAPEVYRKRFREMEKTLPNFKVVWSDRWYYPHELVNQAVKLVDTEFVLFMDNDVEIMPGTVEALIKAAEEEKVGCVHPIYLTEALKHATHKIHVAEGKLVRKMVDGQLFLDSVMTHSATKLADYPDRTKRRESDYFEWHAVLFRKSLLEKFGPLDDLTIAEHIDYSLRITQAGERIVMEPRAVGAYDYERIFLLRGGDRAYMLYRWDVERAARSLERLRQKWNLHPSSTARRLHWVKEHSGRVRHTFVLPKIVNRIRRTLGMPNMPFTREPKPEVLRVN